MIDLQCFYVTMYTYLSLWYSSSNYKCAFLLYNNKLAYSLFLHAFLSCYATLYCKVISDPDSEVVLLNLRASQEWMRHFIQPNLI